MIKTYKILSILLSYPDNDLKDFLHQVIPELQTESLLQNKEIEGIEKFILNYCSMLLIRWQEQYVQLFDFTRSVSLHLFEHVHGESRDRGQAMIDLADEYSKAGIQINPGELPDYLPCFLEYLSLLSVNQASRMTGEIVHIIATIQKKLAEKSQPYVHIFNALASLSEKPADKKLVETLIKNQKDDDPDRDYQEPPVTFSGMNAACANCKS